LNVTEADLNLFPFRDPVFRADPYPFYARAREIAPVYRHPLGMWTITRYTDVVELLCNRTLSVRRTDPGVLYQMQDTCVGQDPPDHTRLRRSISRWFTPRAVARWREVAARHVGERLARIVEAGGSFDAITELAYPVAMRTMLDVLGVGYDREPELRQATTDVLAGIGADPTEEESNRAAAGYETYTSVSERLIALRGLQPGDGLLDHLMALESTGEMSRKEVIGTLSLLYAVSHVDGMFLIAHGLLRFAEFPELTEAWRTSESHHRAIIEEILRIDAPEQFTTRITTQPTTVGDTEIPADERLMLLLGAANMDPSVFPDPFRFDVNRDGAPASQIAFGAGLHGCVGQLLARTEAEIVFTTILDNFGGVIAEGEPTWANSDFVHGILRLPLRLGTL
jgi:cytochrome P450